MTDVVPGMPVNDCTVESHDGVQTPMFFHIRREVAALVLFRSRKRFFEDFPFFQFIKRLHVVASSIITLILFNSAMMALGVASPSDT